MEEKQMMTNEQLEAELKSLRGKVTVAKIMTYGCGAAMVLCILTINIPLIVLFLVLALVGGYHLSKNTSTLKKLLGDNVVSGVLNEVFDNVDYNPFGKIESIGSEGMVFPFSVEKVQGSDHIKATYKGLQVELSDIELYHVEDVYDSENDRWEGREQKVFQGQWLICDFGKELSGEVNSAFPISQRSCANSTKMTAWRWRTRCSISASSLPQEMRRMRIMSSLPT